MSSLAHLLSSPEEFASDVEHKLGRANGNVYQRVPGVEGVHDGQIMVRLKKKRYVVLEYSFQPTEDDIHVASTTANAKIPKGAGKDICKTPECSKIGVPVCIYDSEPNEPDSLYLRSGLCFHCQRNLNEKRRTERKRPGSSKMGDSAGQPSLIYAIGPSSKRFKFKHGSVIELQSDAVIVNGSVEGTKHYGEGYGFQEIGADLLNLSRESAMDTERLVHAVSSTAATAAAAVAAVGETASSAEAAASAVDVDADATANGLLEAPGAAGSSTEDINALYHTAFQSLSKSIFLLTQWKASWDAALAAAHETVADPSLADAVASAAAVVAAAANEPGDQNSANMVSLLLAADKRKEHTGGDGDNEHEEPTVPVGEFGV